MSVNVQPQINQAQTPQDAQNNGAGFASSLLNTATTALTGAALGGGAGLLSSLYVPKNMVKNGLTDVFIQSESGNFFSDELKNLTQKPEFTDIFNKTELNPLQKAEKYLTTVPKNDELLKIVKKAAKGANRASLVASGLLLGTLASLSYNLLSGFLNKK